SAPHTAQTLADLTGAEAVWQNPTGGDTWAAWLPHLDLTAARGFTVASAEHEDLFKRLKKKGALTLHARLDLYSMLHPAVQPDAKLDYEYPPESVTLVLKSDSKLSLKAGDKVVSVGEGEARITIQPEQNRWLPIEVTLATGGKE